MADVKKEPEVRTKESGSSIKLPMLTISNYTVWAMKMQLALKVNKVWETIEPGNKHEEKNDLATALLFQSIPEALALQIKLLDTAKAVWEAIKARHVGAERVRAARLQTLMSDFDRLKMKEEDSINSFVDKLSEISSKSASLGEIIEEPKLVKKFLKSLPRKKIIFMVASLEQMLDLDTANFEDVVRRLKAFEERIRDEEEEQSDDREKLMYASNEDGYGRGRGRGGKGNWRGGRGRGRLGDYSAQREAYKHGQYGGNKDKSHITCFNCDKVGHYASECPDAKLKLQETVEKKDDDTQEADELMMHELVYLNEQKVKPSNFENEQGMENLWYLDNGASNHMSGNWVLFYHLDEDVTGIVRFGDDSQIKIKGKGSIGFILKGGDKKVLSNVYYIHGLRSNIVSLGQATEAGCEVSMKGDVLKLFDKTGQLMVTSIRSKNIGDA